MKWSNGYLFDVELMCGRAIVRRFWGKEGGGGVDVSIVSESTRPQISRWSADPGALMPFGDRRTLREEGSTERKRKPINSRRKDKLGGFFSPQLATPGFQSGGGFALLPCYSWAAKGIIQIGTCSSEKWSALCHVPSLQTNAEPPPRS